MTICNGCGNPLDDSLRYCSSCGKAAPGFIAQEAKPILDDAARPSSPIDNPQVDNPEDASRTRKGDRVSHTPETGVLEEHHSFPWKAMWNWSRRNWKTAGIISLLFTILGGWFVHDWWKGRQRPQPFAIWIDGWRPEVPAGTKLRLTARTSPEDYLPDKFMWSPVDRIEGNGQQSVTLDTKSDDRLTDYTIQVRLVAYDNLGYECTKVTPVEIKVVPQSQLNSKPEWQDRIQMEGSPEVRAGSTVKLEALAVDKDGDKLTYNWSIESKSVEMQGNGTRKVLLKLPRDFAKRSNVTSIVKLNASDGFPDHDITDFVYLTVTPSGRSSISRKSSKQAVPTSNNQAQPQESPTEKPKSAAPAVSPAVSQSPNKP